MAVPNPRSQPPAPSQPGRSGVIPGEPFPLRGAAAIPVFPYPAAGCSGKPREAAGCSGKPRDAAGCSGKPRDAAARGAGPESSSPKDGAARRRGRSLAAAAIRALLPFPLFLPIHVVLFCIVPLARTPASRGFGTATENSAKAPRRRFLYAAPLALKSGLELGGSKQWDLGGGGEGFGEGRGGGKMV
ncbi:hypothetical protein DV515_00016397 [Chloebia gouldiae]|uniref:Uncharacterized protein n=1 Tax=Chloebia gouldiae TaxID=44316 RepID=A0A3L8RT10_CHLGU|nr:hypothetical protein DV515_00016397 [Chloebia gouldiae]